MTVTVVPGEDRHFHHGAVPHTAMVLHMCAALGALAPDDVARLLDDRLEVGVRQRRAVFVLAENNGVAREDERPAVRADDDLLEAFLLFAVGALARGAVPEPFPEREPDERRFGARFRFGAGDGEHGVLGDPVSARGPDVKRLFQYWNVGDDEGRAPNRATAALIESVFRRELFAHCPFLCGGGCDGE